MSKTILKYKVPLFVIGIVVVLFYTNVISSPTGASNICTDTFGGTGRTVINENECTSGEVYKEEGYVRCCMEYFDGCSYVDCYDGHRYCFSNAGDPTMFFEVCDYGCSDAYCLSAPTTTNQPKTTTSTIQPDDGGYNVGDRICSLECGREYQTDGYWDSFGVGCDDIEYRATGYDCCCDEPGDGGECHSGGSKVPDGEQVSSYCCDIGVVCVDGLYCSPHACSTVQTTQTTGTTQPKLDNLCRDDCSARGNNEYYLSDQSTCESGDVKIWTGGSFSCCCGESGCTPKDLSAEDKCIEGNLYAVDDCGNVDRQIEDCKVNCKDGKCIGGGVVDFDSSILIYVAIAAIMIIAYIAFGGKKRR